MKTNDALKQSRRRFLQTAGAAAASLGAGARAGTTKEAGAFGEVSASQ